MESLAKVVPREKFPLYIRLHEASLECDTDPESHVCILLGVHLAETTCRRNCERFMY